MEINKNILSMFLRRFLDSLVWEKFILNIDGNIWCYSVLDWIIRRKGGWRGGVFIKSVFWFCWGCGFDSF